MTYHGIVNSDEIVKITRVVAGTYKVESHTYPNTYKYFISRDWNRGKPNGWKWETAVFMKPYQVFYFGTYRDARDHLLEKIARELPNGNSQETTGN